MLALVTSFLPLWSSISAVSHIEIRYVTIANQIYTAHGNILSVTRPFAVRDAENDPQWGWLGLACKTSSKELTYALQ